MTDKEAIEGPIAELRESFQIVVRWSGADGAPVARPDAEPPQGNAPYFRVTLYGFDIEMIAINGVLQPKDIPVPLRTTVTRRGADESSGGSVSRRLAARGDRDTHGFHRVGAAVELASYAAWKRNGVVGVEVRVMPLNAHPDDDRVGLFSDATALFPHGTAQFVVRLME